MTISEINPNPEKVYALIVGIEKYQEGEHYNLNGPANDAIRFANWLLERGIIKENIWLFISTLKNLNNPNNLSFKPATQEEITHVIDYNLLQEGQVGDLLYIFWGGHGYLTTSSTTKRRLMYNNTDNINCKNLDLESLLNALKTSANNSGFSHQLCLIDACANPIYFDHFSITKAEEVSDCRSPNGTQETHRQAVLFAAPEYQVAYNEDDRGTGSFSKAILEELETLPKDRLLPNIQALKTRLDNLNPQPVCQLFCDWSGNKEEKPFKIKPKYYEYYNKPTANRRPEIKIFRQIIRNQRPERIFLIQGKDKTGKTHLVNRFCQEIPDERASVIIDLKAPNTNGIGMSYIFSKITQEFGGVPNFPEFTNKIREFSNSSVTDYLILEEQVISEAIRVENRKRNLRLLELTHCLMNDLGTIKQRRVIFFDNYKNQTTEIAKWLKESFLPQLKSTCNLILIVAGQDFLFEVGEVPTDLRRLCISRPIQYIRDECSWFSMINRYQWELDRVERDFIRKLVPLTDGNPDMIITCLKNLLKTKGYDFDTLIFDCEE